MPKDLRTFLEDIQDELLVIDRPIQPHKFEAAAVVQSLENKGLNPPVLFRNVTDMHGRQAKGFQLVINIHGDRLRLAKALGVSPQDMRMPLVQEFAKREQNPIPPEVVSASRAPVKEVVQRDPDLSELPIVRHNEMDGGPYIDMANVVRDPDNGAYNLAFLRNEYKSSKKMGVFMSPRHNLMIVQKYRERNKPTPTAIIVGHHPAFYLGLQTRSPFEADEYEIVGGVMGEPLRLVPSETWGEDLLIPADAEVVIEGEIPPGTLEVEGPFGEYPGYYGPQRRSPILHVTAINRRESPIFQTIFAAHREHWLMGVLPMEGGIYNSLRVQGRFPTLRQVCLPISGTCRFRCYLSMKVRAEGEAKQAAMDAMGHMNKVKLVIVVDEDIDAFNEEQVLWAVSTRARYDHDMDLIKNAQGNTLDPTVEGELMVTKAIIDATEPLHRPYGKRAYPPRELVEKIDLKELALEK